MKIYQKQLFGFICMSLIVVFIGVISVNTNERISTDVTQLVESSMKEYKGATAMFSSLQSVHHDAHDLLSEKYRSLIEKNEDVEAELRKLNTNIGKNILVFEKWLVYSKDATKKGVLLAEGEEENGREGELEELKDLEEIEESLTRLKEMLDRFAAKVNTEPLEADNFMRASLEPFFIQILTDVKAYEKDAEEEQINEGQQIEQAVARSTQLLITATLTGFLTAIIIGFLLSRSLSYPIIRLKDASLKISQGDWSARVDLPQKDEVGELAKTFNQMLVNLEAQTKALEHEKSLAEQANAAKSTFLSRMSHELRTPLNAIIGFAQVQQMQIADDASEEEKMTTDYIIQGGRHLLMLVDDILDVVKLEQGKLTISLENVEVEGAIEESKSLLQSQAEADGIALVSKSTSLCIIANHFRLKQVLVNLLSNAIKYNKKGGKVFIQASEVDNHEVEIRVADTGVGIISKDHETIFEPFTRLTYAEEHEIRGTGIGLALTKFLVEQMNGSIGLKSNIKQGTTFWIRFPKGEVVKPSVAKPNIKSLNNHLASEKTILYIEDNPASRELFKMFMKRYPQIDLRIAGTAEEGLKIAEVKTPDLLFIDINLPGMDGITALQILKSRIHLTNSRIFALSADALPVQIEKAMRAGFDGYITKPIDFNKITEIIEQY